MKGRIYASFSTPFWNGASQLNATPKYAPDFGTSYVFCLSILCFIFEDEASHFVHVV